MRRLEGEHLGMVGQRGLDFQQRRAGACGDDQFGWVIGDDAAMRARVEDVSLQRLPVPVLGAAAANA